MNSESVFLTMRQVARLLRVTPARVYQLAAAGELPHIRRGKRLLVPTEAWRSWLSEQHDRALASLRDPHDADEGADR